MKNASPWILAALAVLAVPLAAAQSASTASTVDPYTGKPLALEQLSVQLNTAKLETALLKEQVEQAHLHRELQALSPTHPAGRHSENRRHPRRHARAAPQSAVTVVSILGARGERSALLRSGEKTLSVRNGEQTPYGVVSIPDARHVFLGTRQLTLP